MGDVAISLEKQMRAQLKELLDQIKLDSSDTADRVGLAVSQLAVIGERALLDPAQGDQHRRDASHVYNRLESEVALAQLQVAHKIRSTLASVVHIAMSAVVEVII